MALVLMGILVGSGAYPTLRRVALSGFRFR
jgi:hypothetical protein